MKNIFVRLIFILTFITMGFQIFYRPGDDNDITNTNRTIAGNIVGENHDNQ